MHSCETVWVKVLVFKRMVPVRNYTTNTIMEKTNREKGGGFRMLDF